MLDVNGDDPTSMRQILLENPIINKQSIDTSEPVALNYCIRYLFSNEIN